MALAEWWVRGLVLRHRIGGRPTLWELGGLGPFRSGSGVTWSRTETRVDSYGLRVLQSPCLAACPDPLRLLLRRRWVGFSFVRSPVSLGQAGLMLPVLGVGL